MRFARVILIGSVCLLASAPAARAAWVWSPQTGWVGPTGAVKDTPEEQLTHAQGFFQDGEFERARTEFRKLLRAYPKAREAVEAQYYLGRCEEDLGDYYKAFKEYRKALQVYPSTVRFDEVLEREYRIGNYFLQGRKRKLFGLAAILPARDKAVEIFRAIVEDGPFSEHGVLAQYKLGMAHMALGDYEEAVGAFERVISRYPDSELVDDARYQIALASLKGTFHPEYDQAPTELAVTELAGFLERYPDSELTDEARSRLSELRERRAAHEFLVAQFYERRNRPAAARLYYETIAEEFSSTSWAPKAVARLQELDRPTRIP
ncbi:MAG TPA: outer membrane protein assembly factor BamD [bacterium]